MRRWLGIIATGLLALGLSVNLFLWGDDATRPPDAAQSPGQLFKPVAGIKAEGNAGLFVGINVFDRDDGLQQLSYAVHDAIETAYLFSLELQLIPPENCFLRISGEPSSELVKLHLSSLRRAGANVQGGDRSEILGALLKVTRLASDPSHVLICSFSSHGFEERGDACVMPSDGMRELLAETAIPIKSVEAHLERSNAGHRLLLIDACQERISARGAGNAGQPVSEAFINALQVPSGQAKLASCSPGEFSFEHASLGGVGHGLFTHQLLQSLRGGAQADGENLVRLGDVADYVSKNVTAWTAANSRPTQTPFLQSPIKTRQLPLASKADDVAALIARFEEKQADSGLPADLRGQLLVQLKSVDLHKETDRKLVQRTREFLDGHLEVELYWGYLMIDSQRWSLAGSSTTSPPLRKPAVPSTPVPPAGPIDRNVINPAPATAAVAAGTGSAPMNARPAPSPAASPSEPSLAAVTQPLDKKPAPRRGRPGLELRSGRLEMRNDQGELVWTYGDADVRVKDFFNWSDGDKISLCTENRVVLVNRLNGKTIWEKFIPDGEESLGSIQLEEGHIVARDRTGNRRLYSANGAYISKLSPKAAPSSAPPSQRNTVGGSSPPRTLPIRPSSAVDSETRPDPSPWFQDQLDLQPFTVESEPTTEEIEAAFEKFVQAQRKNTTPEIVPHIVVTSPTAEVKVGSQVVTRVKQADQLRVLEQKEGWFWVEVPAGNGVVKGWIRQEDVVEISVFR